MARSGLSTRQYAIWHRVRRAVVVTAARVWFSFWMIPAVLALVAALASELLITYSLEIDEILEGVPFWFPVGVTGARDILTAISGAMLTVAATTFSITIAVLVLTASNFGPRLVRSFMADRGNQTVLGVFVATFLYCLLTLRSIRSEQVGDEGTFVPTAAVNFALLLAVLCVAVLIWFIHHISNSIQVWTLANGLSHELESRVAAYYRTGQGADEHPPEPPRDTPAHPVDALDTGYVQHIQAPSVIRVARRRDAFVDVRCRPGDFVVRDTVLAVVHGDGITDRAKDNIRAAIVVGPQRTPDQDIEFAVQQLVEMAVRALSPGTNDPYTAVNALDRLSSGLAAAVAEHPPPQVLFDKDGTARVRLHRIQATVLIDQVFDAVRHYGTDHPTVVHRALVIAEIVGVRAQDPAVVRHVGEQVDMLLAACEGDMPGIDLERVRRRYAETCRSLEQHLDTLG